METECLNALDTLDNKSFSWLSLRSCVNPVASHVTSAFAGAECVFPHPLKHKFLNPSSQKWWY